MMGVRLPKNYTCCKRFQTCLLTVIGLLITTAIISTLELLHLLQEESEEMLRHNSYSKSSRESKENVQILPPPNVPVIIWWTPFTHNAGEVKSCGKHSCFFSDNRVLWNHTQTKVILFYGSGFSPTDLPLPRTTQQWALLHEESPKNNQLFSYSQVMSLFNHTATFRRTSDFPLTLQYLENLSILTDLKYYVPLKRKNELLSELAPVIYVQSDCDTPSQRDLYVTELLKHIRIDSYGECLHNKNLPETLRRPLETMNSPDFLQIVASYKFALAFENAICEDYITEKLWRPLTVGTVPIYMGSPSVQVYSVGHNRILLLATFSEELIEAMDSASHANKINSAATSENVSSSTMRFMSNTVLDWLPNHADSAILVRDFPSPAQLADHIRDINSNDTAYQHRLLHKLEGQISNNLLKDTMLKRSWGISNSWEESNFVERFECFLCDRIADDFARGQPAVHRVATEDHYGCPAPTKHAGVEVEVQSNWWDEQWKTASFEAMTLRKLVDEGRNYTQEEYYSLLLSMLQDD